MSEKELTDEAKKLLLDLIVGHAKIVPEGTPGAMGFDIVRETLKPILKRAYEISDAEYLIDSAAVQQAWDECTEPVQ